MHQASTEQYRKMVAAVVAAAARLPRSLRVVDARHFLQGYYANVDPEDVATRDPASLAAAALSHLRFARQRRARGALVRVFNPTLREHGYSSPHTVIEMVNDDMPFLVDSIGVVLAQRSLTLHFLAHPVFAVARDNAGVLRSVEERGAAAAKHQRLESFQHFEVDRIVDPTVLQSLCSEIERSMRGFAARIGAKCAPPPGNARTI
jgi:glutamate dehydrogenase